MAKRRITERSLSSPEPNFDRTQFERVRRETDPPVAFLKEQLDRCYYGSKHTDIVEIREVDFGGEGDVEFEKIRRELRTINQHLAHLGRAGKHYWADGWQSGRSKPFNWNGVIYDCGPKGAMRVDKDGTVTPLDMTAKDLHQWLSVALDHGLDIARKQVNDALPEKERYPDLDAVPVKGPEVAEGEERQVVIASRAELAAEKLAELAAVGIKLELRGTEEVTVSEITVSDGHYEDPSKLEADSIEKEPA